MRNVTRLVLFAPFLFSCSADHPDSAREGNGRFRYVLGYDEARDLALPGGAHQVVVVTDEGKADAIDSPNQPSRLHPTLGSTAYKKYDAALITGQTDWDVFPSNWWNQAGNGVAKRWTGGNQDYAVLTDVDRLSPTEKYDLLFNPGQTQSVAAVEHWYVNELATPMEMRGPKHSHPALTVAGPATRWELQNHGLYQTYSHPDTWWGHCNGWASYATAEKGGAPLRDIRVKLVAGKVTECAAGEAGCVLVRMGDIEALMTELYFSDQATFAGRRCNTEPDKIQRDTYGRPTDPACRDLNPGAFHIGVVGLLNRGAKHLATGEENRKPPFVIDHNYDYQVWNFPLVRFRLDEQEPIDEANANALIGAMGGDYTFNAAATKFVRVKLTYWMVSDGVSDSQMLLTAKSRSVSEHAVELNYVLELDASDNILGGEWIEEPGTTWGEDSKRLHPDFFWIATKVNGWGESADDTGGGDDNPYVAYSKVKALLDCANTPSTCAASGGGGGAGPDSCDSRCGAQAPGGCWCDTGCSQYGDCCADYGAECTGGTPGPSCAGRCGSSGAVPGSSPACYCDSACSGYGDCCSDHASVCSP